MFNFFRYPFLSYFYFENYGVLQNKQNVTDKNAAVYCRAPLSRSLNLHYNGYLKVIKNSISTYFIFERLSTRMDYKIRHVHDGFGLNVMLKESLWVNNPLPRSIVKK